MCFTKKTKFFSPFYQSFENFINYILIIRALLPNSSRIYVSFSTWPTLHSNLLFKTHPVQFVLPVYPWMHGHWMGCGGSTRGHSLKKSDPLSFSICQLPVATQCRGETSCSSVCSSLDFDLLTLLRVLCMLPQSLRSLLCTHSTVSGEQILTSSGSYSLPTPSPAMISESWWEEVWYRCLI